MASRLAVLVGLALLLPACSDPQGGGQIGGEKAGCYAVATTPLAVDEVSPLGFSAADALVQIEGDRTETLLYAQGGDTVLSLGAHYVGGEARFVESEFRSYGDEATPTMDCPAVVEVAIDVSFATADGAFAESWSGTAHAETEDSAGFFYDLDLGALGGTYQVTEVDPSQYDEVKVSASILFVASEASGSLTGQANRADEGPDGNASSERFDVATF